MVQYPSIPIEKCIDITCEFYMVFYHNGITPTNDTDLRKAELFIKCLQIRNRESILQYDDKMYLQKHGLAMGVADSPDLAFCTFFKHFRRHNLSLNFASPNFLTKPRPSPTLSSGSGLSFKKPEPTKAQPKPAL